MGRVRLRGGDWVKSIFLDGNVDPGSTKHVDQGICLGKITATNQKRSMKNLKCTIHH